MNSALPPGVGGGEGGGGGIGAKASSAREAEHGNRKVTLPFRDRMIDVCSRKKNARFAAVTKWQIGVETSAFPVVCVPPIFAATHEVETMRGGGSRGV